MMLESKALLSNIIFYPLNFPKIQTDVLTTLKCQGPQTCHFDISDMLFPFLALTLKPIIYNMF